MLLFGRRVPVHEIALDTMLAASEDEHAQQVGMKCAVPSGVD
jgi:hypothetical protein